jgi:hypothetical protein
VPALSVIDAATAGCLRFTEGTRLLAAAAAPADPWPEVRCAFCGSAVGRGAQRRLCAAECAALEESLTAAWLEVRGVIQ